MDHSNLGERMKKYEYVTRTHLVPRTPVIIRVDGKAFHTFTRGFERPFDTTLISAMQMTMQFLCENIQGCILGYQQSDEISLVLIDYKKLTSSSWFDYNIQKCVSVAASMATLAFNKAFRECVTDYYTWWYAACPDDPSSKENKYLDTISNAMEKGAMFDARVFNVPENEVCNCIYWRQLDATRNSIQMVGQSQFSHRELQGKSCNQIQEMLFQERNINWNDLEDHLKRGSCCVRAQADDEAGRPKWIIDRQIPVFSGEGREYIERLIRVTE